MSADDSNIHRDSKNSILRPSVLSRETQHEWQTIDWLQNEDEAANAARRRREIVSQTGPEIRHVFSNSQGMWSAVACGVFLGIIGIICETASRFIASIRIGICANYFWLGPEQCCAATGPDKCEEFYTWGQFFGASPQHQAFTDFVFYVVWSAIFAMTAALICKFYNAYAAGGGINEVKTIVSGQQKSRYLGGWTLGTKSIAMSFSSGSGLVVGKEGPYVHIGASIGYVLSSLFPDYHRHESKRRELIASGAAGGIALAFGAPVGGVLFSLEEISSFYNFKAMMQALITGVVAVLVVKRVDMFNTGRAVSFNISSTHSWHWFELPIFAIIGVIGGFVGSAFIVANMYWCRLRKAYFRHWKVLEIFALAVISATLNFIVPFCKGSLLELLGSLYTDCIPGSKLELCNVSDLSAIFYLMVAATYMLILSMLTIGAGVPAGVLIPSLCVGALLGRAFGIFLQAVQGSFSDSFIFTECLHEGACIFPGMYAVIASAAVLCGVTRMSICLAVIMFELTGSLDYMVPVIVAILAAKATGEAVNVDSLFELGIEENNFPYLDPKREFFQESYAFDLYRGKSFLTINSTGHTIGDLNDMLENSMCTGFPVVTNDKTLLGYITAKNLKKAMFETATLRDRKITAHTRVRFCAPPQTEEEKQDNFELDYTAFVDSSNLQVDSDSTVQFLLSLFKALGNRMVIVTRHSKFEGIITKKDLIQYMRRVKREESELEDKMK